MRRRAKQLLFVFGLILWAPVEPGRLLGGEPAPAGVRVFYSPATDLERVDRELIDGARRSIDMAAYVLTNRAIMSALAAAGKRGVRVRLYLDLDQATRVRGQGSEQLADLMEQPNFEARFKSRSTDMHMKAFQVDGRVLRSGSANFSFAGAKQQDNDAIVIESAAVAAGFIAEFEMLWARRDNEVYARGGPVSRRP